MSYGWYSHPSSSSMCSEEEDSPFSGSTESSSSEVAHSNSSILQCPHSWKNDLVREEDRCCCVSSEDLSAESIDQPLVGWEKRRKSSNHRPVSQASERSLAANAVVESASKGNSSSGGRLSRSLLSRAVINLGSDSKSSLRSYIHSTPAIPFTFHHHLDGDTAALYMEEYRNSYTYPNMDKRNTGTSSPKPSTPALVTPALVKPTLFVMDNVRAPLQRLDSTSILLKKRLNLLSVTSASCQSSGKLVSQQTPTKHREWRVPNNGKEYCGVWNTGASNSNTSNFTAAQNSAGLRTSSTYVSSRYVTDPIPMSSPTTPRVGGTPITHVKPRLIKPEVKQPRRINTHRKPLTGKSTLKTIVVNVKSLPVTTVYSSPNAASRTAASAKIKEHSSVHSSRDKKYA